MGSWPPELRSSIISVICCTPHAQSDANIVTGRAMDCDAPGARNSNLSPVKATGAVRFRSLS